MSKKLYAAFVPLLAVVAFVALPAVAQAQPQWYLCKEVEKEKGEWTTIKCEVKKAKSNFELFKIGNLSSAVLATSKIKAGTKAVLSFKTKKASIECSTVTDESWLWNFKSRGRDINEVEFTGCKTAGEISTCTVTTPILVEASTRLEEEGGKIYDKFFQVSEEPFTEITLSTCALEGTYKVTGTTRGEVAGKVLKFSGETLKFGSEKAEFTAETEQEGPGGAGINAH